MASETGNFQVTISILDGESEFDTQISLQKDLLTKYMYIFLDNAVQEDGSPDEAEGNLTITLYRSVSYETEEYRLGETTDSIVIFNQNITIDLTKGVDLNKYINTTDLRTEAGWDQNITDSALLDISYEETAGAEFTVDARFIFKAEK